MALPKRSKKRSAPLQAADLVFNYIAHPKIPAACLSIIYAAADIFRWMPDLFRPVNLPAINFT